MEPGGAGRGGEGREQTRGRSSPAKASEPRTRDSNPALCLSHLASLVLVLCARRLLDCRGVTSGAGGPGLRCAQEACRRQEVVSAVFAVVASEFTDSRGLGKQLTVADWRRARMKRSTSLTSAATSLSRELSLACASRLSTFCRTDSQRRQREGVGPAGQAKKGSVDIALGDPQEGDRLRGREDRNSARIAIRKLKTFGRILILIQTCRSSLGASSDADDGSTRRLWLPRHHRHYVLQPATTPTHQPSKQSLSSQNMSGALPVLQPEHHSHPTMRARGAYTPCWRARDRVQGPVEQRVRHQQHQRRRWQHPRPPQRCHPAAVAVAQQRCRHDDAE